MTAVLHCLLLSVGGRDETTRLSCPWARVLGRFVSLGKWTHPSQMPLSAAFGPFLCAAFSKSLLLETHQTQGLAHLLGKKEPQSQVTWSTSPFSARELQGVWPHDFLGTPAATAAWQKAAEGEQDLRSLEEGPRLASQTVLLHSPSRTTEEEVWGGVATIPLKLVLGRVASPSRGRKEASSPYEMWA